MSGSQINPYASPQVLDARSEGPFFRSGRTRGILAIVMFVAATAANIFLRVRLTNGSVCSNGSRWALTWSRGDAIDITALYGAAILLQLMAFVATAICFLAWFYRVHSNLPALGNRTLEFSPWSVVWWWIIPIANLICPCQAMAEIWKGSDPKNLAPRAVGRAKVSPLVGAWWALFLLMNLSGTMAWYIGGTAGVLAPERFDRLITANWWIFTGSLIAVPAALAAIVVVVRVNANQLDALPVGRRAVRPCAAAKAGTGRKPPADDFPFVPPAGRKLGRPRRMRGNIRGSSVPLYKESPFFSGMIRLTEPLYFHIVKQDACIASRHAIATGTPL